MSRILFLIVINFVVSTAVWNVSTIAGNGNSGYLDEYGTLSQFKNPAGIVADSFGNIFIADTGNNVIRKFNANGNVSTFVGDANGNYGYVDGQGTQAMFSIPNGMAIDTNGNIYDADTNNNAI